MKKITFTDAAIKEQGYVVIDGKKYEITDTTYVDGTELNASTFNEMQKNVEDVIVEQTQSYTEGSEAVEKCYSAAYINSIVGKIEELQTENKTLVSAINEIKSQVQSTIDFNQVYPVGSLYMSMNLTDPSTLFGGTWQRLYGKYLKLSDDASPAWTQGGSSSGSMTVDLDTHSHSLEGVAYAKINLATTGNYLYADMLPSISYSNQYYIAVNGKRTQVASNTTTGAVRLGGSTSSVGQQVLVTYENNPEYVTINMWQRIA